MANVIPLFYGTAKQQKDRQKMIDATLALEIANSKKLERANRDYFVNGELPVNSIPDLTTNEIMQDKNKLIKVLASDVKSLLDREQFDLFINDNTWNNLRYLRTTVQLMGAIKEEIKKKIRLLTARQLLIIIDESVANFIQAEDYRNQNNPDYEENVEENPDLYAGFDEQSINGQNELPRRPFADYYENEFGELPRYMSREEYEAPYRRPPASIDYSRDDLSVSSRQSEQSRNSGRSRNSEQSRRSSVDEQSINRQNQFPVNSVYDEYYTDSNGELKRKPMDSVSVNSGQSSRRSRADDVEKVWSLPQDLSIPPSLSRQVSEDSQMSGLTDDLTQSLIPSIYREQQRPGMTNDINETVLNEKIFKLQRLDEKQLIPVISKLINIKQNGSYNESQGRKKVATSYAKKMIEIEFDKIPNTEDMSSQERANVKNDIARQISASYIDELYRSGLYAFPDPSRTGKPYEKLGFGVKHKKGAKVGRGMAVQEMKGVSAPVRPDRSDLYYSFGVFAIHKKSLNDNILNLKYKSFSQVHKYPKRQISEDLKDILVDAIETKKINQKLFNALTDSDKHFLTELVSEARLKDQFSNIFKTKVGEGIAVNENPFDRFEILKGQLIAGNSSNEIKKELRTLINQFMKQKLISAQEGFGILEML